MSAQELIAVANTQTQLVPAACVPVIDLIHLNQDRTARFLVVQDIRTACQKFGCFQIKNHGISQSVIKGALEAASDFFQLSNEEKAEFASEDVTKPVRYGHGPQDCVGRPRLFLKQYAHPLNEWIRFWPLSPPDYREKMGKYAVAVRSVALQLMDAILEGLGLGQAYLRDELDKGIQLIALNCYPQTSCSDPMLGFAPHSDHGYITIILQSCQGLQIIDRHEKAWKSIPEVPETLHVHIGDYLEVLSNGRYRALMHRAMLNSQKKRISVASIHSLSMDEKVITAKELVDDQNPKGYKETSFRDFLNCLSTGNITNGGSFIDSLKVVSS